jgi:hypothetical protein
MEIVPRTRCVQSRNWRFPSWNTLEETATVMTRILISRYFGLCLGAWRFDLNVLKGQSLGFRVRLKEKIFMFQHSERKYLKHKAKDILPAMKFSDAY